MTGADLAEHRRALGLSQSQLARALGVTVMTISKWERGVLSIQHPQMLHLALRALAPPDQRSA